MHDKLVRWLNYFMWWKNAEISEEADYPIEAVTGAEAIMGSTRNESRNSAKVNTKYDFRLVLWLQLGKVYQNYMVDVKPTNKIGCSGAKNMIRTLTGSWWRKSRATYEEKKI